MDKVLLINVYSGEVDVMSVLLVVIRDGVLIIFIDGKSVFFDVKNI